MRMLSCLVVASACFGSARPGSAQAPTGTIEGTISDAYGLSVTTAHITPRDNNSGLICELQSEPNGQFRFSALPVDAYALTGEQDGFAKFIEARWEYDLCIGCEMESDLGPLALQYIHYPWLENFSEAMTKCTAKDVQGVLRHSRTATTTDACMQEIQ
jgi:hypothetical protein